MLNSSLTAQCATLGLAPARIRAGDWAHPAHICTGTDWAHPFRSRSRDRLAAVATKARPCARAASLPPWMLARMRGHMWACAHA